RRRGGWRAGPARRIPGRSTGARARGARRARRLRYGGAVRRYLEGRRRSLASGGEPAGRAWRAGARRRAQTPQAAPPPRRPGRAPTPGTPFSRGVAQGKPIAVLPGFPPSAIFTFHSFVAPVIRALAGLPAEAAETVTAEVPVRIASEMGRQEFVLVSLVAGDRGPVAFPTPKGSGSVTAFSQADGFLAVGALAASPDAGRRAEVTRIGASRMPDLVTTGSHDVALDIVLGRLAEQGFAARTIVVGSQGGVAAAERRECDLAPVHLLDPDGTVYNRHL